MTSVPGRRWIYELTVSGSVGPVLSSALEPCTSSALQIWTVLCVRTLDEDDDDDVVTLVRELDSRGIEFESVRRLPPSHSREWSHGSTRNALRVHRVTSRRPPEVAAAGPGEPTVRT